MINPQSAARPMKQPAFPLLSLAIGLATLAVTITLARVTEADFGYLTRDPAQQFKFPSYAGFLSNVGVLFWMASATVTAFGAAMVANRPGAARAQTFLIALTLLSGAFCLDDFFVLHERIPIKEKYFFLSYALFLAAILVLFRDLLDRASTVHLVLAGGFFALSLGIDWRQNMIEAYLGGVRILLEDGAKFLGAVFWLNFSWTFSAAQIRRGWQGREAADSR